MCNRRRIFVVLATLAIFSVAQCAWASNGIWIGPALNNNWSNVLNWADINPPIGQGPEDVATGDDFTADFSMQDIFGTTVVNVDDGVDPLTIGYLIFDDAGYPDDGSWVVNDISSGQTGINLAVSSGAPTIDCRYYNMIADPWNPTQVTINARISGTQGFNKTGAGVLTLTADNSTPTLTGGINISAGLLAFSAGTNLGAVDGGGVPTNVLRMTGGGGIRYTGTANQTLNTIEQASFYGNFESTAGRLIIDQDLINTQAPGPATLLRAGGPAGGTLTFAAGRTVTMPGSVWFDGDWSAGGVPALTVEIKGRLNSGGYAGQLNIGTSVIVSGDGSIIHENTTSGGWFGTGLWGAGSLTLTNNASLTTLVNGPITNDLGGSFLVGSWSPGPTGAQFNMQDDTVATFANMLRTSVWGDPGSITLSNNERVRVYDQVRVAESTTGSLTMNDNTLMTAASMNIATGAGTAGIATLNDNARIGLTGDLNLNPANDATITATLDMYDNSSVSVGGNTVVNSSISLNGNAKLVIANNLTVNAVSNINAYTSSRLLVGGSTTNDGALILYSTDTLLFNTIADTGGGTLGTLIVGDGVNQSIVVAASVTQGTVTVNAGSQLTLTGWAGGAGAAINAVPEPSTWVLLIMGALGLIGAAWRRN